MKGTEILERLPAGPKGLMRAILAEFQANRLVPPMFRPITMTGGGHTVQVWVATDALQLGEPGDSFRPMTSPMVEQMVLDSLGMYLPTAKVVREAYRQADIHVEPQTQPADKTDRLQEGYSPDMSDKEAMIRHSQDIDKQAGFSVGRSMPSSKRLYTSGKAWVNDAKLKSVSGMACNHGYYSKSAIYSDPLGLKLWQDRGTKHNAGTDLDLDPGHYDYSQTFSEVVYPWVLVDGTDWMDWAVALSDPVLSKAINDNGTLSNPRPYATRGSMSLPILPRPDLSQNDVGVTAAAFLLGSFTCVGLIVLAASLQLHLTR